MAELKEGFIQRYYHKRANGELDIVSSAKKIYEDKLEDWLKRLSDAQLAFDDSVVKYDGMKSTPIKKTDHKKIAEINRAKSDISRTQQKLANAKIEYFSSLVFATCLTDSSHRLKSSMKTVSTDSL